ncbi:MAG: Fructokinase [Rhodospirillaceae bacterium]|nr:MAG: Fructokinase [Rhodospirillaceae bacterium]
MIAVGGENLIDLVSTSSKEGLPVYIAHPGGSPFNVAMAAGQQGAKSCYLTPISSDKLGDLLVARLEAAGVMLAGGRSDKPSSLAVVSIEDGIPSYGFYRRDTAERQVSTDFLNHITPDEVQILHLGSAALIDGEDAQAWEAAFVKHHQAGREGAAALTSLDPNIRPSLVADADSYRARVKRMMQHADILKLSDEDLHWLYPAATLEEGFEACMRDSKAALTVLTKGADGIIAQASGTPFEIPAHKIDNLVDSVGAGDTFMASLLVWCNHHQITSRSALENHSEAQIKQALQRAAIAAALNCQKQGCQPPSRQEIDLALG